MKIVAIDPGTKNVGVASFETKTEYITLLKEQSGKLGVINLINTLLPYLNGVNYIVIEDYAHSTNFNKEEAEFMGMLYYALYMNKIDCEICLAPITSVKAYISKGGASKSNIMKEIAGKLGVNKKELTSHSADAVAILCFFIDYLAGKLPESQRKMLYNRTFSISKNYF